MRIQFIVSSIVVRLSSHPPTNSLQSFNSQTLASVSFAVSAMSTSSSAPTPAKQNVRIISYNLLSSKLARPSHFTHSKPEHLEYENRLPLILAKLDAAMNRGADGSEEVPSPPPPTIFSLQEVCYPFASALHTFFAQRGYHFVTGLYGRPFNGYMGVGIAYPLKDFDTLNVDICRLSDERAGGWPREEIDGDETSSDAKSPGIIKKITGRMQVLAAKTIQTVINSRITTRLGFGSSGERVIDPWKMSENRFNVLLTVALRYRTGEASTFSISNYHMPCAFYAPAVMNIHCEMVAKRIQDLAAASHKSLESSHCVGASIPYIFAGDFNIMPDSPHYKLLTTGKLDTTDPSYPPQQHGVEWKIESLPMDSAYALGDAAGAEPDFTNYAHCKNDPEPFIGCLDYIFLSQKDQTSSASEGSEKGEWWKVRGIQKLSDREKSGGPFPNEKEPSDHFLISADIELVSA